MAFVPYPRPCGDFRTSYAADMAIFRIRTVDGITVVDILNAETLFAEEAIAELAAQLRRLVEGGHTRLSLNLCGVRSMSSDVLAIGFPVTACP